MDCTLYLRITNYNLEKKIKETSNVPIGKIQKDQNISIDHVANAIANMSKEERQTLAANLRAAKVQDINNSTIEKHSDVKPLSLISNISLNDLVTEYPELSKYSIPKDLSYDFTLIKCYRAEFNGTVYKGRTVDSYGNEIFIVNNIYDADKLFKYLSLKLNLSKYIQGNELDEKLNEFKDDLTIISKRYRKNIQQLIENYLINKNAYNSFRQEDKLYSPKRIINKVLSIITNELYDEGDKSDLQLELEAIKEQTGSNNEWKFEKKRLYDVLITFFKDFEQEYTYDQFNSLNSNSLNEVLTKLFSNDVKMIKAVVKNSTQGQKTIKEVDEKKKVNLTVKELQALYKKHIWELDQTLPKQYKDAAKELKSELLNRLKSLNLQFTDSQGNNYDLNLNMDDNDKLTAFYEINKSPKVIEKSSYVTLNMRNWASIGEIYNFGYKDQPLFEYNKTYKGFYIYSYHKNGTTHYAISRSIISPDSYMKTFSDLTYAEQFINNNEDTLEQCGLWSIKQHTGRPRTSAIEMKGIKEGSIITTLDLKLPSYNRKFFSDNVKKLFAGTVQNFHKTLSFIKNIETLDTPEKAVAFIYLSHKILKSNQDYFEELQNNPDKIQSIINVINDAPTISYKIEKEDKSTKFPDKYYLKLLRNDGVDLDVEGKINDLTVQDFIDQNMTEAIDYFNKTFGINITAFTRSELETFSKEHELNLENKLDIVKAFVYNGEIYINTSNANAQDLFHEVSHILLGILKATNKEAYTEIMQSYQTHKNYKYQFNYHKKTYKHYAEQDVIEETVADLIAIEMFKSKSLVNSEFLGTEFGKMFEDVLKRSKKFVESMPDNELGFSNYMKDLLSENTKKIQRNMKISNKIKELIEDHIIKENCD